MFEPRTFDCPGVDRRSWDIKYSTVLLSFIDPLPLPPLYDVLNSTCTFFTQRQVTRYVLRGRCASRWERSRA